MSALSRETVPSYPDLFEILDLVPEGADTFSAITPPASRGRLFGGQVVSQALRAACLTVPADCAPYQLHAQFLRAGQPHVPLTLRVSRPRDGRSFRNRHVVAEQDGKPVLTLAASFHVGESGTDWQPPHALGPHPDTLPHWPSALDGLTTPHPFDLRPVNPPDDTGRPTLHPLWFRAVKPLPDKPLLHECALAFATDFGMALSTRWNRRDPDAVTTTSLDHTVWFHRPVQVNDWHLLSTDLVSRAVGRCLVHGTMHASDGALVASIAQVALIRPVPHPS